MTAGWLEQAPLVGLIFARCGGLMAVVPPVNVRQFPVALRVGIALVLAVALAPVAIPDEATAALPMASYLALLVREAALGALMGLAAALVFWAFLVGGQLIDSYLGAGDGLTRAQGQGPMATLLYLTAGAAFLAMDGHHWLLAALGGSLTKLPLGAGALTEASLRDVAELVREMLVVGVAVEMGFLVLMGWELDMMTVLIATMVIGIGIDYGIHVTHRFREEYRPGKVGVGEALDTTIMGVGKPLVASAVATAGAFLIISFSQMAPIRRFGGLTAISLVSTLTASLLVLPSIITLVARGKRLPEQVTDEEEAAGYHPAEAEG